MANKVIDKAKTLLGKAVTKTARGINYVATSKNPFTLTYSTGTQTTKSTKTYKQQKTLAARPGTYSGPGSFLDRHGGKLALAEGAVTLAAAAPIVEEIGETVQDFTGGEDGDGVTTDPYYVDNDNDGLPDGWELDKFGHLDYDGNDDPDGDGLPNSFEYEHRDILDPNIDNSDVDIDGDNLPDSWEYENFGNLNQSGEDDPDGDGVPNSEEYEKGKDPNVVDPIYKLNVNDVALPAVYVDELGISGNYSLMIRDGSNLAPHKIELSQDLWNIFLSQRDQATKETLPDNVSEGDEFTAKMIEGKRGEIHYKGANGSIYDGVIPADEFEDLIKQSLFDKYNRSEIERDHGEWQFEKDGQLVDASALELDYISAQLRDPVANEFAFHTADESYSDRVIDILEKSRADGLDESTAYNALINEVNQRKDDGSYQSFLIQTGIKNGKPITMGALKYKTEVNGTVKYVYTDAVELNTSAAHDFIADGVLGDEDAKEDLEHFLNWKEAQHSDIITSQYLAGIGDINEFREKVEFVRTTQPDRVVDYTMKDKLYNLADYLDEQGLDSQWIRIPLNDTDMNISKVTLIDVEDSDETGYHVIFWSKEGSEEYWPELDHSVNLELADAINDYRNRDKDRLF